MAARRTDIYRLKELIPQHRQGRRDRAMSRALKMGRDSVRAFRHAIAKATLLDGDRDAPPDVSVLEAALKAEQSHRTDSGTSTKVTAVVPMRARASDETSNRIHDGARARNRRR